MDKEGSFLFLKSLPPDKLSEADGYGEVLGAVEKKFPQALRKAKNTLHELVLVSTSSLPGINEVAGKPTYYVNLMLTQYGTYIVNGLPEDGDPANLVDKLIPLIRKSFRKDVPDDQIIVPDDKAMPDPERGTKEIDLLRVSPNSEMLTRDLKHYLEMLEEAARKKNDEVTYAKLNDPAKLISALT